ncbi:hypothetical protein NQ317_005932 [Molorchus minor]|uniref:Pre-mRNA splicing factor component Cdc5p/Cef1 C-terminal domain-containing protein n=1 Tax=Molorchus minor TaxID=1323400 RepID=A0ABQ9JBB7_9CUCU|nr:hypothetical protein NQ317_005932 [Molorchus minor]
MTSSSHAAKSKSQQKNVQNLFYQNHRFLSRRCIKLILQEAQNMMALTHVDTPLKGGLNTPLHNADFSGVMPQAQSISTPNTVLATPFRSTRSDGSATPSTTGFMTPRMAQVVPMGTQGNFTPSVRDKLNINPEDGVDVGVTPAAHRMYQSSVKEQLKMGLE